MNKKLIAVAVAGALAAPAAALAQSTVQLYGNIYMEYAFTSTGANPANTVNPANVDMITDPLLDKIVGAGSKWVDATLGAQLTAIADYEAQRATS